MTWETECEYYNLEKVARTRNKNRQNNENEQMTVICSNNTNKSWLFQIDDLPKKVSMAWISKHHFFWITANQAGQLFETFIFI